MAKVRLPCRRQNDCLLRTSFVLLLGTAHHLTQTLTCSSQVVFQTFDRDSKRPVVNFGLLELAEDKATISNQLVDTGDKLAAICLIQLSSGLSAKAFAKTLTFFAKFIT